MFDAIAKALAAGDKVAVAGFGTFETRERAARTGRNPQTGEEIQIAASTSPASTEGSWSGSPSSTSRAPSGTASASLHISGRSTIEASSTTTTSYGSGWSASKRKRGLPGIVPSSRCRVEAPAGSASSQAG